MERNRFSATFFVSRSKVRRNGLSPIMMTICCNGNRASFVTGRQVAVTEWDAKRQRVRGTSEHARLINEHLQLLRNRLTSKENELLGKGYIITADLLKDAMTEKIESLQSKTLLQLFAQFLATSERENLPNMEFTDCHINTVVKSYYGDENFGRKTGCSEIDLWRVYNLFTGANKSSYIDTFLDRSQNATDLITGISRALDGDSAYRWFIE